MLVNHWRILTNQYSSSTHPQMMLPLINIFGLTFCYAFINRYKSANFERRRGNVHLGSLMTLSSGLLHVISLCAGQ